MQSKVSTPLLYCFAIALIGCWWLCAFTSFAPATSSLPKRTLAPRQSPLLASLTPIRRELLQQALGGDIALMSQLIADWDLDAQILEKAGHSAIKALPRESFVRSQLLSRQLLTNSPQRLRAIREQERALQVCDDLNNPVNLESEINRFLPQTYVAASFLLALTKPEQILGLPKGLRELTHLFPKQLTEQIPYDVDRYNAESLSLDNPQLAFVAHYSHPGFLETLRNQQVPLFTMYHLDTIDDIRNSLQRVGHTLNRSMEAELLNVFMEAALLAIDNHLWAVQHSWTESSFPRVLVLHHHSLFLLPTAKTLTGQLLQRMPLSLPAEAQLDTDWTIPMTLESIADFDPECLIIVSANQKRSQQEIISHPALANLSAVNNGRIFFVDEIVQQFPSQYVILAYYDLFHALASADLL
ncbi:MAG: ABC transporter substrate-binding protein [Parachlamydiaceae bacterium]|nr:ABC transporter substrate-binding protein [Parachlamydiaceae bacterium]